MPLYLHINGNEGFFFYLQEQLYTRLMTADQIQLAYQIHHLCMNFYLILSARVHIHATACITYIYIKPLY